ncbi:MAG: polysaccharide deacetylase family protein [Mariniphaga sp.]|nr:polysaccharide deacetylase family protein [Mariniphaga sp.]
MRTWPRNFSKMLSPFFSENWLFQQETPCFLPFYHVVSNEKLPHILNYSYRNAAQFEKELDFFLKYFTPVSLAELKNGKYYGKKVFHLSFDDGLRECYEIAAPLLLRKGIPATFFLNTGFVDNRALFHKYKASLVLSRLSENPNNHATEFLSKNGLSFENLLQTTISQVEILNEAATLLDIDFDDFLNKQKPYLTTAQIKNLVQKGFTIGAHSHSHPEFWKISEASQIEEVKKSMTILETMVNPSIKAFSFPFTDDGVPASVLRTVKNEHICDITFGTAGVKNDAFDFHFQRYPMEQPGDFVQNLKGEFIYYKLRKWMGKATVKH